MSISITDQDIDTKTIDIYRYKIVKNVRNYTYKDFNKWIINTSINNDNSNETYYLIIDTKFNDAFAHWVYESGLYLLLYNKLKKIYPNIKLHLDYRRKYKKIFCEYFNIFESDIVYEFPPNNNCIFPIPITSLNNISISNEYKIQLDLFISCFRHDNDNKNINILLLPRQIKENYKVNDRTYDLNNISSFILKDSRNQVLNTDEIEKLDFQINLVNSSNNVILTGGSPYFVNGIFCKNSNIIVIDDFIIGQISTYPKLKYIHNKILETNTVNIIKINNNDITKYLK